ncbi:MAG: hypothetical protein K0R68_2687, partial [Mycobacterium sp.]|nr:hypothetical protein [Mycobacterium sp.]
MDAVVAHIRTLSRFADFVRTGYPGGVSRTGHVSLFALQQRRLSDEEVGAVARRIVCGPPIRQADVHDAITALIRQAALDADAERVSRHLASGGWLVVDTTGRAVVPTAPCCGPAAAHTRSDNNGGMMTDSARRTGLCGSRLVERMAHLAPDAGSPQPVEAVFADICAAAVELIPGADLADVMLIRDGDVISIGATSDLSLTLDQLQQRLGEGPCAQAAADAALVRTDDFRTDPRWRRYGSAAVELGVHSCLSFKLYCTGQSAATMNVFGFGAHSWDDEAETIGAALAAHAAA